MDSQTKLDYKQHISGLALRKSYNLTHEDIPWIMYNCNGLIQARFIGFEGEACALDPNFKLGLENRIDYYYNLEILTATFINKNRALFYSDDFKKNFIDFMKREHNIVYETDRLLQLITRYVCDSSIIPLYESMIFLWKNNIYLTDESYGISHKQLKEFISINDDEDKEGLQRWNEIIGSDPGEQRVIKAIQCKCRKMSHQETYDHIYPDKKSAKTDTKVRSINRLKQKAIETADKYGLPLPLWEAR